MDLVNINIPSFALLRYGTVILRLKMEKFLGHFVDSCQVAAIRVKGVNRVVHRLSTCEQCTRTRLVSQCSDCDSALVGKLRPYRTRAAKSRYVNVCAAVCLLLLVGGLTPQSSAAPHRTRAMDRTRRASEQEQDNWANPCGYDLSNMNPLAYNPDLAMKVSKQARLALEAAKGSEEDVASLHNFSSFESLIEKWRGTEWLRNYSWFKEQVLPRDKQYGKPLENKTGLEKIMTSSTQLDETLRLLTKAMKMLDAGIHGVANALREDDAKEGPLRDKLLSTSNSIKHVLCLTSEVLRSRNLEMLPLYESQVPTYNDHDDASQVVVPIYRDTINFLEYVGEFFEVMNAMVSK